MTIGGTVRRTITKDAGLLFQSVQRAMQTSVNQIHVSVARRKFTHSQITGWVYLHGLFGCH